MTLSEALKPRYTTNPNNGRTICLMRICKSLKINSTIRAMGAAKTDKIANTVRQTLKPWVIPVWHS